MIFFRKPAPTFRDHALALAIAMLAASAGLSPARAQDTPNALQGFSQNRNKPVNIESTSLEVRDKSKEATFLGNVRMTQGDTTLRSKSMVVYYEQSAAAPAGGGNSSSSGNAANATMKTTSTTPGGQQQIKRLEATGGVIVTQADQTVTGDVGVFDMKSNTVTVTGKVVLTRGENVLEGNRLVVDLTSGLSKLDNGGAKGKVKALFVPSNADNAPTGSKRDEAQAENAKPAKPLQNAKPNARPAGLY
jgi:lipopolysaccharide export system protein LptA